MIYLLRGSAKSGLEEALYSSHRQMDPARIRPMHSSPVLAHRFVEKLQAWTALGVGSWLQYWSRPVMLSDMTAMYVSVIVSFKPVKRP